MRPIVSRDAGSEGEPVTGLILATPCYGGMVHAGYMTSMLDTVRLLQREGIQHGTIIAPGDSLVQRGRNKIVAEFMANPTMSHLLFIDADIEWKAEDVLRLLGHGRDMVCGAYVKKQFPPTYAMLPEVDEAGHSVRDPATGAVRIQCAATGFLLIRRNVIATMMEAHPELRYRAYASDGISEAARDFTFSLFDCETTPDAFWSEDYVFSRRWRALGGEVWVDPAIHLKHWGSHAYEADGSRMFTEVRDE